ncbi:unnamed protein product [Amoebophrya sp. A25]|nr:unnamed protein product [Amoebophrya sp. A25]|eukprot:GSA25T00001744001.1
MNTKMMVRSVASTTLCLFAAVAHLVATVDGSSATKGGGGASTRTTSVKHMSWKEQQRCFYKSLMAPGGDISACWPTPFVFRPPGGDPNEYQSWSDLVDGYEDDVTAFYHDHDHSALTMSSSTTSLSTSSVTKYSSVEEDARPLDVLAAHAEENDAVAKEQELQRKAQEGSPSRASSTLSASEVEQVAEIEVAAEADMVTVEKPDDAGAAHDVSSYFPDDETRSSSPNSEHEDASKMDIAVDVKNVTTDSRASLLPLVNMTAWVSRTACPYWHRSVLVVPMLYDAAAADGRRPTHDPQEQGGERRSGHQQAEIVKAKITTAHREEQNQTTGSAFGVEAQVDVALAVERDQEAVLTSEQAQAQQQAEEETAVETTVLEKVVRGQDEKSTSSTVGETALSRKSENVEPRLLFQRRAPWKWAFGGLLDLGVSETVEHGEPDHVAAIRAVKEELGLDPGEFAEESQTCRETTEEQTSDSVMGDHKKSSSASTTEVSCTSSDPDIAVRTGGASPVDANTREMHDALVKEHHAAAAPQAADDIRKSRSDTMAAVTATSLPPSQSAQHLLEREKDGPQAPKTNIQECCRISFMWRGDMEQMQPLCEKTLLTIYTAPYMRTDMSTDVEVGGFHYWNFTEYQEHARKNASDLGPWVHPVLLSCQIKCGFRR